MDPVWEFAAFLELLAAGAQCKFPCSFVLQDRCDKATVTIRVEATRTAIAAMVAEETGTVCTAGKDTPEDFRATVSTVEAASLRRAIRAAVVATDSWERVGGDFF